VTAAETDLAGAEGDERQRAMPAASLPILVLLLPPRRIPNWQGEKGKKKFSENNSQRSVPRYVSSIIPKHSGPICHSKKSQKKKTILYSDSANDVMTYRDTDL
jgi:hypothetical protein